MSDLTLRMRYQRGGRMPRKLRDVALLELGDVVHMIAPLGQMTLIYEQRGDHAVLRCHTLFLSPLAPREQGHGTALHRAVEARVRELGLLFCTADDGTVEGNEITTAMRARLLERYEHERVGDAYVLLEERPAADPSAQLAS